MKRNAERTRSRILDAAADEFAEFGLAGARIDRISEKAKCNKRLIYAYFVNKETLFETIINKMMNETVETVPIEVDALAEFAVALNRRYHEHPQILRLVAWYRLEKGADATVKSVNEVHRHRISTIKKAQELGLITTEFSPQELFLLIISIAVLRYTTTPEAINLDESRDHLDTAIYKAVSRLIAI